jgi:hypothetical protein
MQGTGPAPTVELATSPGSVVPAIVGLGVTLFAATALSLAHEGEKDARPQALADSA